ncbi:MAG: adenosine deaminase [Clostridia bacterium]|nr:adenosine deaminase [Clostridia bacterium]
MKNIQEESRVNIDDLTCLVDLHLHLDGSLSLNSVKQLAKLQNISIPDNDEELISMLSVQPDCRDLNEYLEKFDFPCSLLQTKEAISMAVYNLICELKEQGLMYAEIRFAPQKHTDKGLTQEEVVEAAVDGLMKAPMDCKLILCCMRDTNNVEENSETVRVASKYIGKGVEAIDLAGAEAIYPTRDFKYIFELADKLCVPYTIHAGEADGASSILSAIGFGTVRLGHGIKSVESDDVLDIVKKSEITLECCPTSNLNTQVFTDISQYPILQLLDRGIKVTINTDNMTVSNTTLKNEWKLLDSHFHFTNNQIKQILFNAVDSLFASPEKKEELKEKIEKQI